MIASVSGEVQAAGSGWVVVSVSGVGFKVWVPSGRVRQFVPGESVFLHTSLIVREDALTLYGFGSETELELFNLLLSVNGVGPRIALAILSLVDPAGIVRAVQAEDHKVFAQVSGIGPKTAKLITVSLAGKLQSFQFSQDLGEDTPVSTVEAGAGETVGAAVVEGLVGLGYKQPAAEQAVADALSAGAPEDNAGLLRAALLLLQQARGKGGVL